MGRRISVPLTTVVLINNCGRAVGEVRSSSPSKAMVSATTSSRSTPLVTAIVVGPNSWRALDVVAAVLDETLPPEVTLFDVGAGTPVLWEGQWGRFEVADDAS